MVYYPKKDWKLLGFRKSPNKGKMYYALLENKYDKVLKKVHFGSMMPNYRDITGLNAYPHLIHGDDERRRLYKARSKGKVNPDSYSASHFSFYYLW